MESQNATKLNAGTPVDPLRTKNTQEIFGKIPAWYVRLDVWRQLKLNELRILGVLIIKANNVTHISMPVWTTLARSSGVSRSSIGKATKRLQSLGLIKRWRNGNRVRYQILFNPPEWAEVTAKWDVEPDKYPYDSESYPREPSTGRYIPRNSNPMIPKSTESDIPDGSESA